MPTTEPNSMFQDLLACQSEMPALQKSGINLHFKNRYVPLEELMEKVVPVLNAHNLILTQMPGIADGRPVLTYGLLHTIGERIEGTMLLMCAKDDPEGQGSAITYARRYSLMSLLGLTADVDDDAEKTRTNGQQPASRPSGGQQMPPPPTYDGREVPAPTCPEHNLICNLVPAGTSKATGKPYSSFFSCPQKGCGQNGKSWTIFADKWSTDWMTSLRWEEFDAALPFE